MKTNEFEWIDTINREGLNNSQWGLCGSVVNSGECYGVGDEELPPHLYVYGDTDEVYGIEMERMLRDGYSRKLYSDETHYVAFFWLDV